MSVISDIVDYLVDQGVATAAGTDIFDNYLPDTESTPMMAVTDTGGLEPDKYIPVEDPTFQFYVRHTTYALAKAKIDAVKTLLHKKINFTTGSTNFMFIHAISSGQIQVASRDANSRGLVEMVINFQCRIRQT